MPARKGQKYKPRTKTPEFNEILKCALCPRRFKRAHSQHKYCSGCRSQGKTLKMREWYIKKETPERRQQLRVNFKSYYAKNAAFVTRKTLEYRKTEQGKEAMRKSYQNQKLHNAKRVAARQIVRMAVVGGILIKQPCAECGALKVQAHHEDYDKPLEVVWLCGPDHHKLHKERGDGPSTPRKRSHTGRFSKKIPVTA